MMLARAHMPAAEVMLPMELDDTAPINVGSFVGRFRELNERQCETAREIARMQLAIMELDE